MVFAAIYWVWGGTETTVVNHQRRHLSVFGKDYEMTDITPRTNWPLNLFIHWYTIPLSNRHHSPSNTTTVLLLWFCFTVPDMFHTSWYVIRFVLSKPLIINQMVWNRRAQPVHSVILPMKILDFRKHLLTLSLARPWQNTKEVLKTYEMFLYAHIHY